MNTTIIPSPRESDGWLLEVNRTGDQSAYHATRLNGAIIATVINVDGTWYLSICDGQTRGLASFTEESTALSWLAYVAGLNVSSRS